MDCESGVVEREGCKRRAKGETRLCERNPRSTGQQNRVRDSGRKHKAGVSEVLRAEPQVERPKRTEPAKRAEAYSLG